MTPEQLEEWQQLAEAASAIDRRSWYAIAVPALVAEVKRLRQELAEARQELAMWESDPEGMRDY